MITALVVLLTILSFPLAAWPQSQPSPGIGANNPISNAGNQFLVWSVGGSRPTENIQSGTQTLVPAGIVQGLAINLAVPPGPGASYSFVVRVNSVNTAIGCTISDLANACADAVNSFSNPVDSYLSIFYTVVGTPATTTASWYLGTNTTSGPITGGNLTMNADRMLGRTTPGVGSIEEISIGDGLTLSGGVLTNTAVGTTIPGTPTALVGLTPQSGTGTAYIRADGAPALDQTISPVMTGYWTFAGLSNITHANTAPLPCNTGDIFFDTDAPAGRGFLVCIATNTWAAQSGAIGTAPTASVGLTAVPGSADTFMRSDAAPALSTTISPTMSGSWTFSGSLNIPHSTTPPSTCSIGDVYMDTDAPSGQRGFLCESPNTWVAQTGTVINPAPPTASVGLTAVSGVATTYTRSDAAPALSQAISPTWIGNHTFSNTLNIPHSTSLPATCAVGDIYVKTDAATGQQYYVCITTNTWVVQGGGAGATPGSPTASVGLSVIAGSATTFMRSDAAPPLSQTISPTMSGNWIFSGTLNIPHATIPPGTCAIGDLYVDTDATTARRLLVCESANTWVSQSGALGAPPSVSIGLTAQPGTADTFMRSDSSPALSQSIAPTWTGAHTFSLSVNLPHSTTPPASCLVGDIYMDTDATTARRLLACESTNTWVAQSGALGSPPTVSVGLSTVNGSADTFMRSDAAPALSQTISPTMSGAWAFTGTLNLPHSTTPPASCAVGDTYFDTDATSARRFLMCESANTWVSQSGALAANPTVATVGTTAVNGSATTFMRSDASPPISTTMSPTMSGAWTFTGTVNVPHSTTAPATCNIGDTYMDTDNPTGQRWLLCESANTWVAQGGSALSPANPTASVGTSAVNGSATTYMRSDASPQISQSMSPTWSGTHTFTGTVNVPHSTTLPATCTIGNIYQDTDATSGSRFYLCEATNTWVAVGGTLKADLGYVNVFDNQSVACTDTAINFQITAQGTTNTVAIYLPPCGTGYAVSTNITVPWNITLIFGYGAVLNRSGGTITIPHIVADPGQKIFTGTISTGIRLTMPEVYPGWFGAVCDGATGDQNAIIAAAYATRDATSFKGGVVAMPGSRDCALTASVILDTFFEFTFQGNGSRFLWKGNTTSPAFLLRDMQNSLFTNFKFIASSSQLMLNAIQTENGSASSVAPSKTKITNVVIECTNGGCTDGIYMAQGAGGDANNEFNIIEDVVISNYVNAAVKITHSQSKQHKITRMACNSNGFGNYCVQATYGSFHCNGCGGGSNLLADFSIDNMIDTTVISNGGFENSKRFLILSSGATSAAAAVFVTGNRWAANALHTDRRFVILKNPGPLIFKSNAIDSCTSTGIPRLQIANLSTMPPMGEWSNNIYACPGFTGTVDITQLIEAQTGLIADTKNLIITGNGFHTAADTSLVFIPGQDSLKPTAISARSYGAVCTGGATQLNAIFSTLADAQTVYPHAVALTDTIDWAAIQGAINAATDGQTVLIPNGNGCHLEGRQLAISTGNVNIDGAGFDTSSFHGSALWTDQSPALLVNSGGRVNIRRLALRGTGTGTAISITDVANCFWEDVIVSNYATGFSFANINGCTFLGLRTVGTVTTPYTPTSGNPGTSWYIDINSTVWTNKNVVHHTIESDGVAFANLATDMPRNGMSAYCNDCVIANPCAGSGSGAWAKRLNGIYVCN